MSLFLIPFISLLFISISSGFVGSFLVFKKDGLLADIIAHTSLPGIIIAFIITGEKDFFYAFLGAFISSFISLLFIDLLLSKSKLKKDTVLGFTLAFSLSFSVFLLTILQKITSSNQAGIHNYFFNDATFLVKSDLYSIFFVFLVTLGFFLCFFRQIKIFCFDPIYAYTIGIRTKALNFCFIITIILLVVVGIKTVGSLLIGALIITPVIFVKQWTKKLPNIIIFSILFSIICIIISLFLSIFIDKLPLGPIFIVIISSISFISLIIKNLKKKVFNR